MSDLIRKQDVLVLFKDAIDSKSPNLAENWKKLIWIREHIEELPSAQAKTVTTLEYADGFEAGYRSGLNDARRLKKSAQPDRKTGRWLWSKSDLFPFECDQCSETNERKTPWCPHCGCKMEVEHETD